MLYRLYTEYVPFGLAVFDSAQFSPSLHGCVWAVWCGVDVPQFVSSLTYSGAPGYRSCAQLLSHVQLLITPWTVACQAPLSVGLPRREYWSELPFPPPGDLLDPGTEPTSPALATDSLPLNLRESMHTWAHEQPHADLCACLSYHFSGISAWEYSFWVVWLGVACLIL